MTYVCAVGLVRSVSKFYTVAREPQFAGGITAVAIFQDGDRDRSFSISIELSFVLSLGKPFVERATLSSTVALLANNRSKLCFEPVLN